MVKKKTGRAMNQGKEDIGLYNISDFALNWSMGLSMALISILEFAKWPLYGITR